MASYREKFVLEWYKVGSGQDSVDSADQNNNLTGQKCYNFFVEIFHQFYIIHLEHLWPTTDMEWPMGPRGQGEQLLRYQQWSFNQHNVHIPLKAVALNLLQT